MVQITTHDNLAFLTFLLEERTVGSPGITVAI